jgi:hypothetical protein
MLPTTYTFSPVTVVTVGAKLTVTEPDPGLVEPVPFAPTWIAKAERAGMVTVADPELETVTL